MTEMTDDEKWEHLWWNDLSDWEIDMMFNILKDDIAKWIWGDE